MQLLNDIRNYYNLSQSRRQYILAFLVALSGVLSVIDFLIPKPIPFAKLGIANIITLILVLEERYILAIKVAFFRTLVASMVIGTFISYTYLLSTAGAIFSVVVMIGVAKLFNKHISAIGISVWGALAAVFAQGVIVSLFFGFDNGIAMLLSIFVLVGLLNSVVIALLAKWFYKTA